MREFDARGRSNRDALRAIEARAFELEIRRQERLQILEGLTNGLLFPGVEFFLPYFYESLDTLAAYLPADTLLWLDGAGEVDAALEHAWTEIERRATERAAEHRFLPPVEQLYITPSEWRAAFADRPTIELEPLDLLASEGDAQHISVHSFLTRDLKIEHTSKRKEASFAPVADACARLVRRRAPRRPGCEHAATGGAADPVVREPRCGCRTRRGHDRRGPRFHRAAFAPGQAAPRRSAISAKASAFPTNAWS